ncbi:hypothetical protein [Pseudomonas syringae]|uniref:hypothetical protein n=1 Tax=Pseudomonas syringae TaxID=317 RepID=UPI0018E65CBA|nr:hypothetical protein [Pseudomonas syringae]MBI6782459.1 hypothetical protein [Pseudomonas syringae]
MKIYMCVAKSDAKKGPVLLKALILYGASPISRASRIGPVVGAAIGRHLLSYPMPQLPYELCLGSLVGRGLPKATRTGNLRHAERRFELRGLLQLDVITERIHFS